VGDFGMMYLPGQAPPGYTINSYAVGATGYNLFAFTGTTITGNSSTVNLYNTVLANTGIQVTNAGVYLITWGLAMATMGSTTPVPAFYANLAVNGTKLVGKYQTISCDTGATLNTMQSLSTIMSLNAGDILTIYNGTGTVFYINSLNGNGGPAAYITLFRLQ
jgi:hypothetical protein